MAGNGGVLGILWATQSGHATNEWSPTKFPYLPSVPLRVASPRLRVLVPAFSLVPVVNAAWGFSGKAQEEENKKTVSEKSPDELLIEQADSLYKDNEILKLYDLLVQHKDCSNDDILWRLARAACDKAKMSPNSDVKKTLMNEGFAYVKRALDINDKNFACHKWYAILLDYTAEFEGTKQRLINAFHCKEHFKRAVELNPTDATSVYLLGYWCFLFADLPWYQRKVAAVVFTSPPESSYEEALQYFEDAERTKPNFYSMNLLMLGKSYLRLNNKDKAKEFLLRARDYPTITEDDKQANKEAIELLKSMGINE